ncbi:DUF4189 domain-containing protein [uncultured Massilia sp.]|uniref:DUF4189 domain-containing protein n=1 Tax=uncultured Massilia sp. TaxID=169973 RepID=UPI0025D9FCA0|nr:DUF4189 domain-containing protein [uncultured Massilia sp.]
MTILHPIRNRFLGPVLGLFLGLFLGAATLPAMAAAAFAMGDNNYTHMVTEAASLAEARELALQGCAKQDTHCRIGLETVLPMAFALAKGDDGMTAQTDPSPEAARDKALASCRKKYKNCKFTALYWEPGGTWAAWAVAKNPQGDTAATAFVYEGASAESVRKDALEACRARQAGKTVHDCKVNVQWGDWAYVRVVSPRNAFTELDERMDKALAKALANCKADLASGEACKVEEQLFNAGTRQAPASFARLVAQTEVGREAARAPKAARAAPRVQSRNVQQLTCRNQCVNGSCVRTFPDGRSETWQAPRVFDPLSNDWKWDTNRCGG